uniref:Putative secreted protein n=1 Tax=Corethrella appendiculata TaxID=1370023 RepID=U5EL69_9DIPT
MLKQILLIFIVGISYGVSANRCAVCTSNNAIDTNCLNGVNLLLRDCPANNNNNCFSRIEPDGSVRRGCLSELSQGENLNCVSDPSCTICNNADGGCNVGIFPGHRLKCHTCQGSVNSTCAEEISGPPSVCDLFDPNDQCYTVVGDDRVQRGCRSSFASCQERGTCRLCDGHGCNYKHYNSSVKNYLSVQSIIVILIAFCLVGY